LDSEKSESSDKSGDSLKDMKISSPIHIGKLEDAAISEARKIFIDDAPVQRRRDESEPYDNFLKNCKLKKIVPSPMGIVKQSKEVNEVIQLNEYGIGNEYASVLAKTFKKTNQRILRLNMRNNKLADDGAVPIINNLTEYIVDIDFSWNQSMNIGAYDLLGQKINSTFYRLK